MWERWLTKTSVSDSIAKGVCLPLYDMLSLELNSVCSGLSATFSHEQRFAPALPRLDPPMFIQWVCQRPSWLRQKLTELLNWKNQQPLLSHVVNFHCPWMVKAVMSPQQFKVWTYFRSVCIGLLLHHFCVESSGLLFVCLFAHGVRPNCWEWNWCELPPEVT